MNNIRNTAKNWRGKLSIAMELALIAVWMMISTGCAHYKVISADRTIHPLRAGETWHAPVDGWFVPDARWLEIRQAIAEKIEELENHDRTNSNRD
jgi:hypothetical protein